MIYKFNIEITLTEEQFKKVQEKADCFGHGFDNATPKVMVQRYLEEAVRVRVACATDEEIEP